MSELDLTVAGNAQSLLREMYLAGLDERMLMKDHALLALLPKTETFKGRHWWLPVRHALPAGRAMTFAQAQANRAASESINWIIPRRVDYGLARVEAEAFTAGDGDNEGAFIDLLRMEIDGILDALGNSISRSCFGSEGAARGQIGSGFGTTTWVLKNVEDVYFFALNQTLRCSLDDGNDSGDALKAGTAKIVAIDEDTGTLEVDKTGLTEADDDFLFVDGDFQKAPLGLESWLPPVAPTTGDSFTLGAVDRSIDASKLAGIRVDSTSDTFEDLPTNALARGRRSNVRPNAIIVHPQIFAAYERALESRKRIVRVAHGKYSDLGFDGLAVRDGIPMVEDADAPIDRSYYLNWSSWLLASAGPLGSVVTDDSLTVLRASDADSVEVRVRVFFNLGCRSPGQNMVQLNPPVT